MIVRVDVPDPPAPNVTELGLNEPLVLLGRALTLRLTVPLKLLMEVSVTV